jgi:hypothetical protein
MSDGSKAMMRSAVLGASLASYSKFDQLPSEIDDAAFPSMSPGASRIIPITSSCRAS